jgi:hypothetical protein
VAKIRGSVRASIPCVAVAVALVSLSLAGTAAGVPKGRQKALIYGPEVEASGNTCSGGATATPQTFGSVVLDTPAEEATVTAKITLKHATPSARFQVTWVERQPLGVECHSFFVGTLTTNGKGAAKFHFSANRSFAGPARYWVSVLEESPFAELLASSAVELD